jgi:flagellar hook-length control protein FliK
MTITLSDNLSQTGTLQNNATFELKSDANSHHDGQSFGQLMSGIFQLHSENPADIAQEKKQLTELAGQEVAVPFNVVGPAGGLESYVSALNAVSLKAVTLGPHLSVITPENAPPDSQSLEAFARAQGLDENAVNWLFGSPAAVLPVTSPANTSLSPVLTSGIGIGAPESTTSAQGSPAHFSLVVPTNASTGQALLAPQASTLAGQATVAPPTNALTGQDAASTQTSAATGQASVLAQTSAFTSQATAHGPTTGAVTSMLGNALTGAQALWAMADEPGQAQKPSAPPVTEEALPIPMLRMPPPAAVWMQRNVIQSMLQNSQNTPKETTISLSELDLGADWGGETLQQLLGAEGSTSTAGTGSHGTAHANFAARWEAQSSQRSDQANPTANANGTSPDLPDTNTRSENIQNLADKMGQAVGQRILTEMEKGQWHLKLQLRPATLGHIEVEMRMRSGEFDAVFIAPNATTRDLLQDGMGKLRETLSQMGMDVANIHVGGGQTGQSGGDSTPGFSRGKNTQAKESTQETTSELSRAPRVKDPKDGLDVLV